MVIEKYSHVIHVVSQVEGKLSDDKQGIDAIRATFPAGTVSGAPKIKAIEIIDSLEAEKRGFDLFVNEGRCVSCHIVEQTQALFTDNRFQFVGQLAIPELQQHGVMLVDRPGVGSQFIHQTDCRLGICSQRYASCFRPFLNRLLRRTFHFRQTNHCS